MIKKILTAILLLPTLLYAQINTERVMTIARNALYLSLIHIFTMFLFCFLQVIYKTQQISLVHLS